MKLCNESKDKLESFVRSANPSSLHPLDIERWGIFLLSTHKNKDSISDWDIQEYFNTLESKKFQENVIDLLTSSYEIVKVTLNIKDTGKAYPNL